MNPSAGQTNKEVFSFLVYSTGLMESIQKARPKNTVRKNDAEFLTNMIQLKRETEGV
jgi:hypothetical protein